MADSAAFSRKFSRKTEQTRVRVLMKAPRGKLRQDSGVFVLATLGSASGPFAWGTIPNTLADDGQALDAVVVDAEHSVPGEAVMGEVLGALMVQLAERDQHRPERDERLVLIVSAKRSPRALSGRARERVQAFVVATGEAGGKRVVIEGWEEASYATDSVQRASAAFESVRA
jgi:inorganic pyrophosphatase